MRARAGDGRAFGLPRGQEPQLGTGHALLQAEPALAGRRGTLVLLSGDVPLLRPDTLERAGRHASQHSGAAATVLTATCRPTPRVRPHRPRRTARIAAIVEHEDATPDERRDPRDQQRHLRVRSRAAVRRAARRSAPRTRRASTTCRTSCDLSRARARRSKRCALDDPREIRGINSRRELADVAAHRAAIARTTS